MKPNLALSIAIVPPAVFLALCFKLKTETQLQIAGLMSIIYAFIMTGTILSIIGNLIYNNYYIVINSSVFIMVV